MLQPTGITIRIVESEVRRRWSEFDEVWDVGLCYRLRVGDRRPPEYTVIPRRAMDAASPPSWASADSA